MAEEKKPAFYPSTRHHKSGGTRVIQSADQEHEDWKPSPADHGIETAPGVAPDPAIEANKPADDEAEPTADADPNSPQAETKPRNKRGKQS